MLAALLDRPGAPLRLAEIAAPEPKGRELLLQVSACAVCRTDLHVVDGDLTGARLPLVPGHQIVGVVAELGPAACRFAVGERVGVPWLAGTCGACDFCRRGEENLCDRALFTGYTRDGGFAELCVADERYCLRIPGAFDDRPAAPLLCAGLIGFRALSAAGDAPRIGFFGFGSAARLMAQIVVHEGRELYAFTRPGDRAGQDLARGHGAVWAGGSDQAPPAPLDAALIFAPAGELVPTALRVVRKGGSVVCAGIHMSEIPAFPYELLWGERSVRSVANLTRRDGEEFLETAAAIPITPEIEPFPLARAHDALEAVRRGDLTGTAVLVP